MGQDPAQPGGADRARPEVLVAVHPRPELGLRIVQVDHRQAFEADPVVELGDEPVDALGRIDRIARAPQVGGVEADRDAPGAHATGGDRLEQASELRHVDAQAAPATGRVLEDDQRRAGLLGDLPERDRDAIGDARDPGLGAAAFVRAGMDVDEARAERRRDGQLVAQEVDRLHVERLVGPGKVEEIRRVDRDRTHARFVESRPERGELARRFRTATPGRRVVAEDLERVQADRLRSIDRGDHPPAERQVGAEPAAVGKHGRIVAGRLWRWTPRPSG